MEGQYRELASAIRQREFDVFADFLTPDFTGVDLFGRARTRDQVVDAWQRILTPARSIVYTHRIESLQTEGMSATAVVRGWGSFTRTGPDGRDECLNLSGIARESWRLTCEGWRQSASTELERQVRRRGELVRHGESVEAAAIRQQLQPLYDAYASAIVSNDLGAVNEAFPSGTLREEIDGAPTDVQQMVAHCQQLLPQAHCVSARFEIVGVDLQGDRAVVLRTLILTSESAEMPEPTGTLGVTVTARDTWLKTSRGWSPRTFHDLLVRKTRDDALLSIEIFP